jgi:L-alanine-DL-glutamate epimerase-like enolase superfamily enzyme
MPSQTPPTERKDDVPHESPSVRIDRLDVSVFVIPTDHPESDGTFTWNETTAIVVEVHAADRSGVGYTYGDRAAAAAAQYTLADAIVGGDAMNVTACWVAMNRAVRNAGRPGIASTAISAVDAALWDLKGRLLGVSLMTLLGCVRSEVEVYGSGGFTSYSTALLCNQLSSWVGSGIRSVKMKVGRERAADSLRVREARFAIGERAELFVDANGAWTPAEATAMANCFEAYHVTWFEEPVSSDDLDGLKRVRDRAPTAMEIAAGEYGYDAWYFRRMLESGAVDVLQADATRCGGITGFLQVGALCDAFGVPLSAHTAPSLHGAPACALPRLRHIEYFHDHARVEQMLFDGALTPQNGCLHPDGSRPGLGLDLKRRDAERFRVL